MDQKNKSLPYSRQQVDEADIEAVVQVLRSDFLTQGPVVEQFEAGLARRVGAKEAVAVSSGTAALHLAALALDLGPGDAWITSPLTFLATANAPRYVGARPVFADVDETGCLDPASLPAAVERAKKDGLKPKVLAGVDYAGQPADWAALGEIAQGYGLSLVDDGCHALGGRWQNEEGRWRAIGGGKTAKLTAFSFHPVKAITTGEGGALTTDDGVLAARLRRLRSHGQTKAELVQPEMAADPGGRPNPWYYEQQELGFNYRLTDIQAALGLSQLSRLDEFLRRRRALAQVYDEFLAGNDLIRPLARRPGVEHAFHLYVVRVGFQEAGVSRAEVMDRLKRAGIKTQVHFVPIHLQPDYRKNLGTGPGDCPTAEALYQEILSLPLFPGMSDDDPERVVGALAMTLKAGG